MPIPIKVLVVDDDPVDLELTCSLLRGSLQMYCHVEIAHGVREALDVIGKRHFDVLLLDIALPDSYGLATIDAIRASNELLPIVVLSGMCDELTALSSLDRGIQDYLVKGQVNSVILIKAIRYAIQRQQLLKELTSAKELLERKNQRLAELYDAAHHCIENLSHEFRTPLTVIKEYTALLREGLVGSVTEEQGRFLDIVNDRADDLNVMVDDMLDVSKLEAGLLCVWRRQCRVADIVKTICPSLERKAAIKGITLTVDIDDLLTDVYCDEEKIRRVIINLTINALKFSSQDGRVCIAAKPDLQSGGVQIEVTDNGPGIASDNLAVIFDRFKQLHAEDRPSCKGFGLGLNIAKELVDINFGEIGVRSEVGKGSTFWFTLPPAEPMEVTRRYLNRIAKLQICPMTLAALTASIEPSEADRAADDVDIYLQCQLRRHDLLFRTGEHCWMLLLAINSIELPAFLSNVTKSFDELNRNRLQGPLPKVTFEIDGSWHAGEQSKEILEHVHNCLIPSELQYG